MEYLKVGTILKTHGLKGGVRVFTTTSFKNERFKKNKSLFLQLKKNDNSSLLELHIKEFHELKGDVIYLEFKEINNINEIEKYLNLDLLVLKDESILKKDQFFYSDLISLDVIDNKSKELLGVVKDVKEFNNQANLIIKLSNGKEINLPFNDYFFPKVDLENKKIYLEVIEGLLDI